MALDPELRSLNKEPLTELRRAWQNGRLSVVVGAGASAQASLPAWTGVLDNMLVSYVEKQYGDTLVGPITDDIQQGIQERLQGESPIVVAHYLQSRMSPDEYLDLVHASIYGHLRSPREPGPIARAVGRLGSKLDSVITFNYDDLIEKALSLEGTANTCVWRPDDWSRVTGLPVYHPHGLLPFQRDPNESYWIVLAEGDYHTQYTSTQSWSNIAVARALLETTCLFVSISITDPNLRRMLDVIHRETPDRYHYFVWETPEESQFHDKVDRIAHNAFEDVFVESHKRIGLKPVWFHYRGSDPWGADRNYNWRDIPQLLDAVREL